MTAVAALTSPLLPLDSRIGASPGTMANQAAFANVLDRVASKPQGAEAGGTPPASAPAASGKDALKLIFGQEDTGQFSGHAASGGTADPETETPPPRDTQPVVAANDQASLALAALAQAAAASIAAPARTPPPGPPPSPLPPGPAASAAVSSPSAPDQVPALSSGAGGGAAPPLPAASNAGPKLTNVGMPSAPAPALAAPAATGAVSGKPLSARSPQPSPGVPTAPVSGGSGRAFLPPGDGAATSVSSGTPASFASAPAVPAPAVPVPDAPAATASAPSAASILPASVAPASAVPAGPGTAAPTLAATPDPSSTEAVSPVNQQGAAPLAIAVAAQAGPEGQPVRAAVPAGPQDSTAATSPASTAKGARRAAPAPVSASARPGSPGKPDPAEAAMHAATATASAMLTPEAAATVGPASQIAAALVDLGRGLSRDASGATAAPAANVAAGPTAVADPSTGAPSPGTRDMVIRLDPEHLGAVSIRMRLTGGKLDIDIRVANPQTLDLLNKDRHVLSAAVEAAGGARDNFSLGAVANRPAPSDLESALQGSGGQSDSSRQQQAFASASSSGGGRGSGGSGGAPRSNITRDDDNAPTTNAVTRSLDDSLYV